MDTITLTLIGITLLFFLLLIIKNILSLKKTCVICLSVILAWISLLAFYYLNIFNDKTIIAILMGQTSLGLFYTWEKKTREKFKVFRLPLLLSFIFIIYSVLESFSFNSLVFIMALWVFFFIVYLFRTKKTISSFFNKILECCKRW